MQGNDLSPDPDFNIHTMPTEDKHGRRHIENRYCWCEPTMNYKDPDTGKEVWLHKGYEELDQ